MKGINGSGRAPANLTLDHVRTVSGITGPVLPPLHIHTVTVPGAAAGWVDCIERFGSLPLADVLAPAIQLAEDVSLISRDVSRIDVES